MRASQVVLVVKNPYANAGDVRDAGSTPGSGSSPGEGNKLPIPVFLPRESHRQIQPGRQSIESQRVGHD